MSNQEKEYQEYLKSATKKELLELVEHYRELAFDLKYKLDNAYGKCKTCNAPLDKDYKCILKCETNKRKKCHCCGQIGFHKMSCVEAK